jgi:NADH-quinone oxidoreductase subunit F
MSNHSTFKPILLHDVGRPGYEPLAEYRARGGYKALEKAVTQHAPDEVTEIVKQSGLRGRGGAGFPAGLKWSFLPKGYPGPRYLVCNADEGEPGTCKDRPIMEKPPHLLLEGIAITCYAIRAKIAYIYVRGEYYTAMDVLEKAIDEAYKAGLLGKRILGKEFDLDVYVHPGAGAYICGEETALLDSLEGKRGYPRLKPPFPAVEGLYRRPTIINNVETLASIPSIIEKGAEWFKSLGREKSSGFKIYPVSGHVKRPGNYEVPMKTTLRQLIYDYAGGIRNDRKLKAVIPGGSSTPVLAPDSLDVVADFEGIAEAGSMLGSAGIIVMDETVCMVWVALKLSRFYHHESCGQCTPCREGTAWITKVMERMEGGQGRPEEIDLLLDLCHKIDGRCICPLGDAATPCIKSTIQHFRHEYEQHIALRRCPFRSQDAH